MVERSLDDMLQNVSVVGAAGLMGKGIAALLATEMLNTKLRLIGELPQSLKADTLAGKGVSGFDYKLNMIDLPGTDEALADAKEYILGQADRYARHNIDDVRELYRQTMPDETLNHKGWRHNRDIIARYVQDVSKIINPQGDKTGLLANSKMVFEAIVEDEDLKIEEFKKLKKICGDDTLYFSNTSSIPISKIDEGAGLNGNIIGMHFYNPPPLMPLLEMISNENTNSEIKDIALELAKERLGKIVVESNDVAGFIGNGHFARECIYAANEVERLVKDKGMTEAQAIYTVNDISKTYFRRAMGIFQTVDYVGLGTMRRLINVMNANLNEDLQCDLVERYLDNDIAGGQFPDMSQKDGLFKYEKKQIAGVVDFDASSGSEENKYHMLTGETAVDWIANTKQQLRVDKPEGRAEDYYKNLAVSETEYGILARDFFVESARIANQLVEDKVAKSMPDMLKVLKFGFGHREAGAIPDYAPIMPNGGA